MDSSSDSDSDEEDKNKGKRSSSRNKGKKPQVNMAAELDRLYKKIDSISNKTPQTPPGICYIQPQQQPPPRPTQQQNWFQNNQNQSSDRFQNSQGRSNNHSQNARNRNKLDSYQSSSNSGQKNLFATTCSHCNGNHRWRNCDKLKNEDGTTKDFCAYCKELGHVSTFCPSLKDRICNWQDCQASGHVAKFCPKHPCAKCKRTGHTSDECRVPPKNG